MRSVYVTHPAATLHREGEAIAVRKGRVKLGQVFVKGLEQLVLMGNIVVTPGALDLLVREGVDTVFMTQYGRYRGRIVYGLSGNVRLRMAQYELLGDDERSLGVARSIVAGKIASMRSFLMRIGRERGRTDEQRRSLMSMRACRMRLESAKTFNEVRGCEGSATAAYFRCFDDAIVVEGFRFDGRNRRPPMDPVNALLSFGYTLLHNAVEAAVNIVGLDPYVGSLHSVEVNRPSLACDLVEELRVPVVDRLVVAALNKRVMQVDDFEDAGPGEPVIIRPAAVKRFVGLLERRLESQVTYAPQERKLSFRHVIEQQVRAFARLVLGRAERYEPYAAR